MSNRILLVDDDADTARVFQHLLRIDGYAVSLAADMAAALNHLETQPFDLLITDIELPDGSGLDLLQRARLRQPLKGIVVTGHGEEAHRQKARQVGFDEYMVKPVDLVAVRQTIGRVLGRSD
jgi:DNA-binding response OmpR family regulator